MSVPHWQQLQKEGDQLPKIREKIFTIITGISPPPLSGMKRWMPAVIGYAIGIPPLYSINEDAP